MAQLSSGDLRDELKKANEAESKKKHTSAEPLTAPTLSQLQNMPKEALQLLLERVCAARWGEMALLSDDAAHDAVCLKLLQGGMAQSDINKALPALREWVDRKKGKAAQSLQLDASIHHVTVNTTIRFADELPPPVDSLIIEHVGNSIASDK